MSARLLIGREMILWSTEEFGFLELTDAVATGSSIMPQKRNLDAAELIRGKWGRVTGNLVAELLAEQGVPGFDAPIWIGMLTGARTPAPIVNKLSETFAKVAKSPDVAQQLEGDGSVVPGIGRPAVPGRSSASFALTKVTRPSSLAA